MRAAGFEPLEPYPGSETAWRCRCTTCGAEVTPRLSGIRVGYGCEPCSYAARGEARKTPEAHAVAVMRAMNLEPLEKYPGRHRPWKCRCIACGAEVSPHYSSVDSGNGGCRFCAPYGSDWTKPSRVYVLHHLQLDAVKVGIAAQGARNDRIARHAQGRWRLHRTLHTDTGHYAWLIEQAVLRRLRLDLGLPPYLTAKQMPQGGFTETASAAAIPPDRLWTMVCEEAGRLALGLGERPGLEPWAA